MPVCQRPHLTFASSALAVVLTAAALPAAPVNLFGPSPKAELWYPPYAKQQPQWVDGKLTVDLKQAAGKPMAVLQVPLPTGMQSGATYVFAFSAAAEPSGSLIVGMPEADPARPGKEDGKSQGKTHWSAHGPLAKTLSLSFVYQPDLVEKPDRLTFYWDAKQIGLGTVWTFSEMTLVAAAGVGEAPVIAAPVEADPETAPFPTKFWYPPYARRQPTWREGKLVVDLKEAAGKKLALVDLQLPENLEQGADYVLRLKASADPAAALIVTVPEPHPQGEKNAEGKFKARSSWGQHGPKPKERIIEFVYQPDLVETGAKITFFWNEKEVAKGSVWTFSDLKLERQ